MEEERGGLRALLDLTVWKNNDATETNRLSSIEQICTEISKKISSADYIPSYCLS